MRKKFRFLTVLAVCVMVLSCFSVTAFAYADDTDQNLPVTEATQPEQQPETTPAPEKPKGEPIDDEATPTPATCSMTRQPTSSSSLSRRKAAIPSSLSSTTMHPSMRMRNSIRRISSTWSMRATWLALLDDDTAATLTTCNCKEKCAAGQVNTDCPVCKTNMSECTGTAPATPEPDKDAETDAPAPKPEKKSNVGMILVIFALAGAAGAAYYYIKFVKGRKPKDEDMDFFDDEGYEEEPYINEDDEPQIAEDAETEGDED